jgi:hypothetical protein
MEVVSFNAKYLRAMVLQDAQKMTHFAAFDEEYCNQLIEAGPAYTVLQNGNPIMCAGLAEMWSGRFAAWAWLSEDAGRSMIQLTRIVDDYLNTRPYRRIEAYVDNQFSAGHRWAKILRFEYEGLMRGFGTQGQDMAMYSRIQ